MSMKQGFVAVHGGAGNRDQRHTSNMHSRAGAWDAKTEEVYNSSSKISTI